MGELPIRSKKTVRFFAATTTALQDVIILRICCAFTVALPDAEENSAELAVFHTDFHFGFALSLGYLGMVVAALFQFRVPDKLGRIARVKMVCTGPSTADIQAIEQTWGRMELLHDAGFVPDW